MISALVLCVSATLVQAPQKTPDFSGTWAAEKMSLNFDGVAGGSVIRIEQDAKFIRIRRSYGREGIGNPPVVLAISLDGKDTSLPYSMTHSAGRTGTLSAKARWDGTRLVIVTTRILYDSKKQGVKTETIETFSLEGPRLIVERVPAGGTRPAVKDVWVKQS